MAAAIVSTLDLTRASESFSSRSGPPWPGTPLTAMTLPFNLVGLGLVLAGALLEPKPAVVAQSPAGAAALAESLTNKTSANRTPVGA